MSTPARLVAIFAASALAATAAQFGSTRDAPFGMSDPGVTSSPRSMVRGDGLPPRAPNAWFFEERAFPLGKIPRDQWRAARRDADQLGAVQAGSAMWTQRGPTNIGGRITDLVVHPTDADIVYIGAAEGGVLRTTDGGQSWTPLFDDQPTLAIGAVALDPTNPDIVYAGTGEVNPGGGSVAYGGSGLYRSTDQGTTWTSLGLEDTGGIGRIRIDPTNPDRIYVAAMGLLWDTNEARGVYRSLDGGATWERVLFTANDTGCVDLIQRPDDPDVLYAAMWERLRQPEVYDYGGAGCAVYRSVDGGDTWDLVQGGLPAPSADGGRIGLSLCASQPDVMHVIYADRIGYFDGLYRSEDGGFNWTQTNDANLAGVYSSFGWWFGNVRTHPTDPDTIFVVGFDFYRSTDGGASYQDTSGIMHVDHHALDFGSGLGPTIYAGNDGGVYRSTNGGTAWTKLVDLPITQAYRLALDASNPAHLYVGSQDNGTCRTTTGAVDDYEFVWGGDGFQALVHPQNPNQIWAQFQYGNLRFSNNGGASFTIATNGTGSGDRHNWNSPVVQDPLDPNTRYFGTNMLYRSLTATTWTAISPDLTGGVHQGNNGQVNGTLTTIGVSPVDNDIIWTGSDDGRIHVTDDGGVTWSLVSLGLPQRWITSVRPDPITADTAYVTISGFRWNDSMPRVYRTTNLGASWTAISGTGAGELPDAPANDLLIDPDNTDRLVIATDVGVFETTDGGQSWTRYGSGLPNVVVTSLAHNTSTDELIAGTYGRSVFSIPFDADTNCPADLDGDGAVAVGDLLMLLGAWGTNGPGDLDGDGDVAVGDLLMLLAAWGPCA